MFYNIFMLGIAWALWVIPRHKNIWSSQWSSQASHKVTNWVMFWHSAYYTFCQSQACLPSLDIQINDTFLVYYVCNSVAAGSLAISSTMDQINANLESNILLHTTHTSWWRNLHKFTINVYHADFKGGIQLSIQHILHNTFVRNLEFQILSKPSGVRTVPNEGAATAGPQVACGWRVRRPRVQAGGQGSDLAQLPGTLGPQWSRQHCHHSGTTLALCKHVSPVTWDRSSHNNNML